MGMKIPTSSFRLTRYGYILIACIVLGVVAYHNAFDLPFVHDDVVFILQNPDIQDWTGWKEILFPGAPPSPLINRYYRPVLEWVYRLEYLAFDFHAAAYHAVNIFLHIFNSFLLFLLIFRLGASQVMAAAIGAFFLLHPVQAEAVACVSGISNVLSTAFIFSGLLFFLAGQNEKSRLKMCLGFLSYLASLLTKESSLVTVLLWPLVMGTYHLLRLPDMAAEETKIVRRRGGETVAGLFLISGIYFLWRQQVLGTQAVPSFGGGEIWLRIAAIPQTMLLYVRILLLPYDLHYYRTIDLLRPPGPAFILLGAVTTILAISISRISRKRQIWAGFGAGWFILTLLPVVNVIPLIHEYSLAAAFDHFLYLPCIGFFILAGVIGDSFLETCGWISHFWKKAGLAILIGLCLMLTIRQNTYWQNEVRLFERTVRFEPQFGRAQRLLGETYLRQGWAPEARRAFQKALAIMRGYLDRATVDEARTFYQMQMGAIYVGLAESFELSRMWPQAVAAYGEALALPGVPSSIYNHLGICYVQQGDFIKASEVFGAGLRADPRDVEAMNNLAICYIQLGRQEEARGLLEDAIRLAPDFQNARQNLENLAKGIHIPAGI